MRVCISIICMLIVLTIAQNRFIWKKMKTPSYKRKSFEMFSSNFISFYINIYTVDKALQLFITRYIIISA